MVVQTQGPAVPMIRDRVDALDAVPRVFAMFLVGLYVGRLGMLTNVEAYAPRLRQITVWGALAGLPLSVAGTIVLDHLPIAAALFVEGAATWLWRAFAAAGRMALSNYLLHSIARGVLFYGIGFDLFGRVSLIVALALGIACFAVHIVASDAWLSRAAFGPAESIWRMFTYGRRLPLFNLAV